MLSFNFVNFMKLMFKILILLSYSKFVLAVPVIIQFKEYDGSYLKEKFSLVYENSTAGRAVNNLDA